MKTRRIIELASIALFATGVSSCMDDTMHSMHDGTTGTTAAQSPLSVTYPAAYIAIGSGNRLAIIDMEQMTLRDTLSLTLPPGSSGTGMMSEMNMSMGNMGDNPGMSMMGMSWPHHLALSPDGRKLAVAFPGMDLSGGHDIAPMMGMGMGGGVAVFDATTGMLLASATFPRMNHNAAWSPDGKTIWTSQMMDSGKVLILESTTLVRLDSIRVGGMPAEVSFNTDGTQAFVANGMSGTVTVIDVATRKALRTITVGEEPVGAWPASGGHMYVDNEIGKSIHHIHGDSASILDTIALGFTPGMAAMHRKDSVLWVSDADAGRVVCFHRSTMGWHRVDSVATGAGAHAIAFTKDGSKAWITNQTAGTVSVVDVASKTVIQTISVGAKPNGIVLRETY